MQFIVTGYDGTDEKAQERRLASRDAHIKTLKENIEKKNVLYGAAILNDEKKMVGSVIICEFASRDALKKEWLSTEPYVIGNVWQKIEIKEAQIPPFLL
jgi:uncharacterized protein